jgi:hypothetical protein
MFVDRCGTESISNFTLEHEQKRVACLNKFCFDLGKGTVTRGTPSLNAPSTKRFCKCAHIWRQ